LSCSQSQKRYIGLTLTIKCNLSIFLLPVFICLYVFNLNQSDNNAQKDILVTC